MDRLTAHFFIFLTILLGLYGQVVLKWQVDLAGREVTRVSFYFGQSLTPQGAGEEER